MNGFDKLPTPVKAGVVLTVFPLLVYVDFTSPKPTGMWMLFVAMLALMAASSIYNVFRSKDVIVELTKEQEAVLAASAEFRATMTMLENIHGLAMETASERPDEALAVLQQLNLNIHRALNPSQE